jgi:hypothetical protein
MQFSHPHSAHKCIMSGSIALDTSLAVTADVRDRGIIIVWKVQIQIDPGIDRLPHVVPALFVSVLDASLAALLTSGTSARGRRGSYGEWWSWI